GESDALAEEAGTNRARWELQLAEHRGRSYSALDQMVGLSYGVNQLLSHEFGQQESSPPKMVRYAVIFLLTRAISTAHEVCALLRAGFPVGATARWRTLYELSVVSGVLRVGNRGTAARYVNHRWVLVAKEAANQPDDLITSWGLSRVEIERKEKAFIRR